MDASLGPELPVGTKIGFYEVLPISTSADGKKIRTCLGYGGFGSLYKVSRGSKVYALKLAHRALRDFSPAERKWNEERGDREVGALKLLRHPNIVRVHGFDMWPDEEGRAFIVMDLVEGNHLDVWRATQSPSLKRICEVFIAIGRALGAAHRQQVFHRDLKCENVLVRTADGQPIIVDWGIARPRNARTVTAVGGWLGTCTHFSPEYCRYAVGDFPDDSPESQRFSVTPQSELHAVGFMLFQLLTDESPFPSDEDDFATMRSIINHQPVAPSTRNPNVPKALDAIVLKLLAKAPGERYESGDQFADALEALLVNADKKWTEPFDLPLVAPLMSVKDTPPALPAKPAVAATVPEGPRAAPAVAANVGRVLMPTDAKAAQHVSVHSVEIIGEVGSEAPTQPPKRLKFDAAQAQVLAAKGPRRMPSGPVLVAAIVALSLGAFVLIAKLSAPAKKPESLLARVQAEENLPIASATTSAALDQKLNLFPPAPGVAAGAGAKPVVAEPPQKATTKPSVASDHSNVDERAIDQEIAAKYGRPQVVATTAAKPDAAVPSATTTPEDDTPAWLRPVGEPKSLADAGPKLYGVPTGVLVRARLQNNLDSRTVADGPATAKLVRPFVVDGKFIFPSGTLLFGQAAVSGARFTIHFNRLRLPDRTEVPFEGLAYSVTEHQPGLAASRSAQPTAQQSSTAGKVAKGAANTLLSAAAAAMTGNVATTVASEAGRTALGDQSDAPSSSQTTLMLDEGADLDVFIVKAF